MSNVWWCNQTICCEQERKAGVVCCAKAAGASGETYRAQTVSQVRTNDIIVHYISSRNHSLSSPKSIIAISRAKINAKSCVINLEDYGVHYTPGMPEYGDDEGWLVEVKYFDLKHPIPKDPIFEQIRAYDIENTVFCSNGFVKQGYFLPFNLKGLEIVYRHSKDAWPTWATRNLKTNIPE